ncbi:MAG TPA: DUF885 domain-containing protein, partial [Acidimicrobiia bacterium]|nr:DUF885 domain-containing protein [Acidimicrobiia bacterium]
MTLEKLADRFWKKAMEMQPTIATVRGVHDYDHLLPSIDEAWVADMSSSFRGIIDKAEALDVEAMTTQEQITRSLLIHQCQSRLGEVETPFRRAPVDPFLGPHTRLLSDTRQNTVTDADQADALLERYARVPSYLSAALGTQIHCTENGQPPAAAVVDRVLSQLDGYLVSDLAEDPFLALKVPGDPAGWRDRAETLVTEVIRPAFQAYRIGLADQIAPRSRPDDRCGISWIEGGEEIYADLVTQYTQLPASPEEIHAIGEEWATGINADEWVEIGARALGVDTLEEIFDRLRSDADLRFDTEDEMLDHARRALDRAWAAVDDWFGARPETPCQVGPVPPATAPAMPPAYYSQPPVDGSRPGTYFLNTYKPEERDRFEYESIHFHEGIPGHHFDRSLAAELDGIPTFRRYAMVYAHTEGWGLYSERLADEMGLYSSDLDRLGMISADAWRAGRLVTDTGIHALGWSRQQAIDFL